MKTKRKNAKLAKAIGGKVLILRKSRDWTQKYLGAKIGMRQPDVCDLENGRHVPETVTLIKLANAFGVSLSDLLSVA